MVTAFGQPPDKWKIDNSEDVKQKLEKTDKGIPIPSAKNFYLIFKYDNFFSNVYLDTMKMAACRVINIHKRQQWQDSDDAISRLHIEEKYGLRNAGKTNDAFLAFLTEREFSPIQERIKSIVWDGEPHVEQFYIRWLKADNSQYNREVTRMDYLQRIKRAFEPGCKADQVPVLKGSQGSGKSTLIRWSALEDELYASVTTIEGQKGYEAVQGKFICELEELLATVGEGTKKENATKAFISGQSDHYRRPYDRRTSDNPRTCVFIGTTNRDKFLTDMTGNRRWYPIDCRLTDGTFIFDHEAEIKADIEQCYAEMYHAWVNHLPLASPVPDRVLLDIIRDQQEASEMEDYRVGLIERYILTHGAELISCIEIWEQVLQIGQARRRMTKSESNEIGELLRHKLGCRPVGKKYFPEYGTQHAYEIPNAQNNE